jgi:hypothetical protein
LALFLVIPAAFAWACGGSDDNILTDSGSDGTVGNDSGPGKDGSTGSDGTTTNDTGTNDTGTNDTGTSDTGTSDTGTSDGGVTDGAPTDSSTSFACTKPSDCTNSFCCGTIVFNGGQLPNCTLEDASSACKTTCNSNVTLSCKATDTVRSCTTHAECADAGTGYTDCCDVPFGDAAVEFCWTKTYAQLINGATCL